MTKKYRLRIPEMIHQSQAWIFRALQIGGFLEFGKVRDDMEGCNSEGSYDFSDIPKDWLEEIREPKTFEELWEEYSLHWPLSLPSNGKVYCPKDLAERFWKAAIENYKLEMEQKHEN